MVYFPLLRRCRVRCAYLHPFTALLLALGKSEYGAMESRTRWPPAVLRCWPVRAVLAVRIKMEAAGERKPSMRLRALVGNVKRRVLTELTLSSLKRSGGYVQR